MSHGGTEQFSALSGGWRMRAALAQALFIEPDILLLVCPSPLCMHSSAFILGRAAVKIGIVSAGAIQEVSGCRVMLAG